MAVESKYDFCKLGIYLGNVGLNVFDKLNAPTVHFIKRYMVERWFNAENFETDSISIIHYAGVRWSLNGMKSTSRPGGGK